MNISRQENLINWVKEHPGFSLSFLIHLLLILFLIFWSAEILDPEAISTAPSLSNTPIVQAEVLNNLPSLPIQTPVQIQTPAQTPAPAKPLIEKNIEKNTVALDKVPDPKPAKKIVKHKHHLVSKPVSKPVTKPTPPVVAKTLVKTDPKKLSSVDIKKLQAEAKAQIQTQIQAQIQAQNQAKMQAQLQAQIAAQNQARYLTERDQYLALLNQIIRARWINQYQDQNLQVTLKIQQDASGLVTGVSIVNGSGNSAFDQSAIMAIEKSSPLPLPKDPILLGDTRQMSLAFS